MKLIKKVVTLQIIMVLLVCNTTINAKADTNTIRYSMNYDQSAAEFLLVDTNPYLKGRSNLLSAIEQWTGALYESGVMNGEIAYTNDWYSGLSTVEKLARMIYGENDIYKADQDASFWVILNRYYAQSNTFGKDITSIITKPGQFIALTGSAEATELARSAKGANSMWYNAIFLACTLCTTTSKTECEDIVPKPSYINSQVNFFSCDTFRDTTYSSSVITNIAVPGVTSYASKADAIAAINKGLHEKHNIFFSIPY